ncbi:heme exporter protein CcmB [Oceanibacterium hippocampi]|uniref:Heme exporter protein B n=1 Tax=Oceanibacterium hippocampi TaxID=745714 RepID=A0A1Y5RD83_9PROT|nr:heme exporter protein CcmB [Oceanibacterium hippocampi]SLN14710.1 Heme exporter protein B [Oceanibacterium hippocampi]
MRALLALLVRDLRLAIRQGGTVGMTLGFFVITVTLFPLGVGPELELLSRIAAGVIWVAAMLASLISLDRIFQADYEDGSLELIALGPTPLELVVLAKALAHWLTTGLPLLVTAPLLAVLLNLPVNGFVALIAAMLLGTPALSLIGAIGAALTVGVRRGGVLLSLLVLPLYIPILIFGVAAVEAAIGGFVVAPHLAVLGGLLIGATVLTPWASAAALRLALE